MLDQEHAALELVCVAAWVVQNSLELMTALVGTWQRPQSG